MAIRLVKEKASSAVFSVSQSTGKVHVRTPLRGPDTTACNKRIMQLTDIATESVTADEICGSCAMVAAGWLGSYYAPKED